MMSISADQQTEMYKKLLWLRRSEETLAELYRTQEMRTPTHFGVGQEAVAVGVCQALNLDDVVYSHHRCHNHYLAKGGDLFGLTAELYGREGGCARGRGGSVHLTAPDKGFIISSAILGQTIAVATGSALAFKMDGLPRIAVSFFGDAAAEEGIFYESMNYASVMKLPVLFVCENNLYSTETPLSVRQPIGTEICERVGSFKMRAEQVDGNDVFAVYEATCRAVEALRNGEGPAFLECMTYRWLEHVGPHMDHELGRTYRSKEELETWTDRCPIKLAGGKLIDAGTATETELAAWLEDTDSRIRETVAAANDSPWPDPANMLENVY